MSDFKPADFSVCLTSNQQTFHYVSYMITARTAILLVIAIILI